MAHIAPRGNGLKPTTRAEARRWNTYNNWDWFPIRVWPRSIAESVIKENLGDKQRFALFMFLIGNGMDPEMAVQSILDMKEWNEQQQRHIKGWLKRLHTLTKYTYWDIKLMRTMPLVLAQHQIQRSFEKKLQEGSIWETHDMIQKLLEKEAFNDHGEIQK